MASKKTAVARKSPLPATVDQVAPVTKKATKKKPPAKKPKAKALTAKPAAKAPAVKVRAKKQKPADKKPKTVRDSFNMPADDYALIGVMKKRAIAVGREIKKSELLRAGLKTLAAMTEVAFAKAVAAVPAIKTGRPIKKRK